MTTGLTVSLHFLLVLLAYPEEQKYTVPYSPTTLRAMYHT